ncbi:MAG TPA: GNAT family N-acetyltransferase [Gaiellaceae bacterium]|nr:GNAT family N-acetyltransferase [Gaiellaceae bacterium]
MSISPPSPPLTDGVVLLRPWIERDVDAIRIACNEQEIAWWLDKVPQPYTEADARTYVALTRRGWKEATHAAFAITDAATAEVLGSVGVHWLDPENDVAEIGYWVRSESRGRHVATRATRLAAEWAIRSCGTKRLQLRADERNVASQRVAEAAGFRREGVLRSARWNSRQGRRVDFVIFSLLEDELEP